MASPLRTIIDGLKMDENVSPRRVILLPNGSNRDSLAEKSAPPAGAYRDVSADLGLALNPSVGDWWRRTDAGVVAPQRRIYVATTGGGSPVWEPLFNWHTVSLGSSGSQTPDLNAGNLFAVLGMTGDVTFVNPTNGQTGDEFVIVFSQDATGGRKAVWGTNYATVWQPNPAPSSVSVIRFIRGSGGSCTPVSYGPAGAAICIPNYTPVNKAAAVTTDQVLMTYTLPAGALNGLGRTLRIHGAGRIVSSVASYTGVITFKIRLGAQDLVLIASAAIGTQTLANSPWELDITAIVQSVAANAGKLWAHGRLSLRVTAAAGAQTIYQDVQTTTMPAAALDLTTALAVDTTVAFGTTASASNSCTEDEQLLEVLAAA